ncbi:uncharacterized protein EV420DRAFT_1769726 [Desarmillaria tabescens]|uniref:Uncharacterized protein n=1 Tax=Armillaria tabescens TaxID=1929756 RepID=A0AA39JAS2_ARMTA|nr:uncharacterized protein EV420DRAFT_1769726 [Desarmillaria tabescens]KAK0438356.1 hypothetical protein EV420DRAFT_1769726 [Desarmillaria tabescens]
MLRFIRPYLKTLSLVRPRYLCTHTELEKEIFELQEALYTLQEFVEHPKAVDYLRAVHAYHYEVRPESSSEERWAEVCCRLKMPKSYDDPNELIYGLAHYSPPQMYLPQLFYVETYKTVWKFLNSFSSPFESFWLGGDLRDIGLVEPVLFGTTSLFYSHVRILRNKPIPQCHQLPDPLPLGEPVSYQIMMHEQIKLVVIEMDAAQFKFTLHDQEVYTRLFTELYAASQYNNYIVDRDQPLDLRVYGLLTDTAENVFFSYDPATATFEKDENVCVDSNRNTIIHDMMRLSEKLFSVLMHAYNEQLEDRYSKVKLLPKEDLPQMYIKINAATTKSEPCDRTLLDLLAEAVQDAKLASEKLSQHWSEDALKEGLQLLRKSLWVLPLAETTHYCWLGLHDDLDQMAVKAASSFRREKNSLEKKWKDQEGYKTYEYFY